MFDDDPQEIGDFDTVLTRWIDGSPVCRSVDNFDIRKFKGIKPVYLPPIRKVYPDPDQRWDDLGEFVQQSWRDFYDTPMPEKERQNLFATINSNNSLLQNTGVESDTLAVQKQNTSVQSPPNIPGYNVSDKSGEYLFLLGDSRHPDAQRITAKELYDKGLQWFAPTAENFIPMDTINPAIAQNAGVLHVKREDLYNFANSRHPAEYNKFGPGNWKVRSDGGNGYILAEVNGLPYWVDGLGQIPYAIDAYRYFYFSSSNRDKRRKKEAIGNFADESIPEIPLSTLCSVDEKGWSDFYGRLFGKEGWWPDFSNSSDNYLLDKTLKWYENYMMPYEWNRQSDGFGEDANNAEFYRVLDQLYDYGYDFRKNKR